MNVMNSIGRHYIAELYNCKRELLDNLEFIENAMNSAIKLSGATIIKPFFYHFTPHGISGVIIIAESHFAIHTWPEYNYAAIDLFSCGDFKIRETIQYLGEAIRSNDKYVYCLKRGMVDRNNQQNVFEVLEW